MEILGGIIFVIIITLLISIRSMFNDRIRDAKREADAIEEITRVRREAENAKHDDPDAVKRMFDKYNK